jgi:hypothetical protein
MQPKRDSLFAYEMDVCVSSRPKRNQHWFFVGLGGAFVRVLYLLPLLFLAGCVCDPPVDRIASKRPLAERQARAAVPRRQSIAASHRKPTANSVLKRIRVRNCDCPEDFDPKICGNRSAYTSWSPSCPSAAKSEVEPTVQPTTQ